MRFRFLGLSLAGLAAVAPPATHQGLKIVTRETFPAGTHEKVEYVADDRARLESRVASRGPDGGAQRAESIVVRRCDLDRAFVLRPGDRTFEAHPLEWKLNGLERFAISLSRRQKEPTRAGAAGLVVETTTIDRGERKTAFRHTARHVVTTRKDIPVGKTAEGETITDGWYIDLEARPKCERQETGRAVLMAAVVKWPADAQAKTPRVTFRDIGDPERGFAIETTTTWRASAQAPNDPAASVITHSLVTEISSQQLDAKLFEVPAGYHSTDGMFASFAARWGRTAQIVQSVVASWFR